MSMATSLSPTHFSVSSKSQQSSHLSSRISNIKAASITPANTWKFNRKEMQENHGLLRSGVLFAFIHNGQESILLLNRKSRISSAFVPSVSSSISSISNTDDNLNLVDKADENNYVDSLVEVLHKSARIFSVAIKYHESAKSSPELAMSWVGVDVHAWHKHLAYQVAVYTLLKTAIEARFLVSDEHRDDFTEVQEIISTKISKLLQYIESQLRTRDPNLTNWFKIVQLPLLSGLFIPIFKRWSAEHDKSVVPAIFLAISCYVAVGKIGAKRISCPTFTLSVPNVIGKLMDMTRELIPLYELHRLSSAAGVEHEFLSHFGTKVVLKKENEESSYWLGLVQEKLSIAFEREGLISKMQEYSTKQDLEAHLATLGLLAFLGNRTRMFLSKTGIKDLDERLSNFLSYLECGSLFVYPEFSSLPLYQHFMEVVAEEIGWLDLYAAVPCISHHERKRSKQHALQAEQEIILSAVFNVCSDVFSGFAHFSNSTEQSLDANVKSYFLHSRNLLTVCLEDYWAAYCRSGELLKFAERLAPQEIIQLANRGTTEVSVNGVNSKSADLMSVLIPVSPQHEPKDTKTMMDCPISSEAKAKPARNSMLRSYMNKLICSSIDILLGTRLLFIDMSVATGFLLKQVHGHMLTERETKKLKRTLVDFATVIPVTILMLLPVSAVGHAAMLAGIKRYIPCLIPSQYSSERLDIVKQLSRTKKMKVKKLTNP
ncbi:hypothetical protein ACHQM5_002093 [Ranunculus cassubicifolius]